MSREDEIYMASENTEMPFTTEVAQQVLRKAWRQGAVWADEHQPSPWIDINSNLPKINKQQKVSEWLFLRLSNGETVSIPADRLWGSSKYVPKKFLGQQKF